jgi:hypothetical protein
MSDRQQPSCYYLEREQAEREAAAAAPCEAAKLAHERLADLYAQKARSQAVDRIGASVEETRSNLVILIRD